MKTIFTEEEVRDFLMKKGREIQGDAILLPSAAKEADEVPKTFAEMVDKIHNIGIREGIIEGKLALMKELVDFFEVAPDE